jgi:dUTP pyrophosphatase
VSSLFWKMVKIRRRHEEAILPTKGTTGAAGYDLYTPTDFSIGPGDRSVIDLGIEMEIPSGVVGVIKSRSGLASRLSCDVGAGVIDSDYRGSVGVLLCNNGKEWVHFKTGDRIAQILFLLCYSGDLVEVDRLTSTNRGEGGFGSTDKRKDEQSGTPPKRTKQEAPDQVKFQF